MKPSIVSADVLFCNEQKKGNITKKDSYWLQSGIIVDFRFQRLDQN